MGERRPGPAVPGSGRRPNQNAPRWRRVRRLKGDPRPKRKAAVSKRDRAKAWRKVKRHFGLNRRQMGAIGAGHMAAPDGYVDALVDAGLYRWIP